MVKEYRRAFSTVVLAALVASAVSAGCVGDESDRATSGAGLSGTLRVFAAASLTDAFGELGEMFERQHPGVTVELNFAGSSSLAGSILEGAPADVFALADGVNMQKVVDAAESPVEPWIFAHNLLEVAVPKGNPAGVTGLADFARRDLLIGLCAARVPCGDLARQALARADVIPSLDTNEPDVRALLTKIEAGELDAGIVYRTDVAAADGTVVGIGIPDDHNVVANYWIASLAGAKDAEVADAFIKLVVSRDGRQTLKKRGFLEP